MLGKREVMERSLSSVCRSSVCRSVGSEIGVAESEFAHEPGNGFRDRFEFEDHQAVGTGAEDRRRYVQRLLRTAAPVPSQAESVDPGDALTPRRRVEEHVTGNV